MRRNLMSRFNKRQKIQGFSSMILLILLVVGIVLFINTYRDLNQSIQSERKEAVEQLGNMISRQLTILRNAYTTELEQKVDMFMQLRLDTMDEVQAFFDNREDILLVRRDGTFLSLNGEVFQINNARFLEKLIHAKTVMTEFITIQTKGDFWVFGKQLDHIKIGEEEFVAIIRTVDMQTYTRVASVSLYGGNGGAYIVHQDGSILFRPGSTKIDTYFQGYNLFRSLDSEEDMPTSDKEKLKKAISSGESINLVTTMNGITWQLQNKPLFSDQNVLVAIPVSVTAEATYSGLYKLVLIVIFVVGVLASLVLIWIIYFLRRGREVREAKIQAQVNARNEFMSKMSHDIRTPLHAIVGIQEYAMESIDDKEVVYECLKNARTSSDYLISIINDVLDMNRIDSGKVVVRKDRFRMTELLDRIFQIEGNSAKEKEIDFSIELETPIENDFIGDMLRIQQCLINLTSNAIKFTPNGGKVKLIYKATPRDYTHMDVQFTVIDNGIGMSPEFLERSFQPFEQEQSSLTSVYKGSGLGLSIVKNLVTMMGGQVEVQSKLNEGSIFTINLLLEKTEKTIGTLQKVDIQLPDSIKGKRILLVEDNQINRLIVLRILTSYGLIVEEAVNGREAVEKFNQSEAGYYALIFMDIQMPIMNGLEAARSIRKLKHPDASTIPVIALSANAFEEDTEESLKAGMQVHLAKPINLTDLKKVLCKYIDRGNFHETDQN